MNAACEQETQSKRKLLGQQRPVMIHAAQSNDAPVEKIEKQCAQKNIDKIPPMVLSQLKEIRSEMALLKDLRAEVSQIRESIQQQPPAQGPDPTSVQQFPGQQRQGLPQGHWFTPGPGHREENAQYHQSFDTQRSVPPPNRGRMRRCFGCQQRGIEHYCTHCYRCGSSEHFLAGCRAPGQRQVGYNPLNGEGSLARDRE